MQKKLSYLDKKLRECREQKTFDTSCLKGFLLNELINGGKEKREAKSERGRNYEEFLEKNFLQQFLVEKKQTEETQPKADNESPEEKKQENRCPPQSPVKNIFFLIKNSFVETQTNVKKFQSISQMDSQGHIKSFENFNVFLENSPESRKASDPPSRFPNCLAQLEKSHIRPYETSNQKSLAQHTPDRLESLFGSF